MARWVAWLPIAAALLPFPGAAQPPEELPDRAEIAKMIVRATGDKSVDRKLIVSSLLPGHWELLSEQPADGAMLISTDGSNWTLGRVYEQRAGRLLELSGSPSRLQMVSSFSAADFIAFVPEQQPSRAQVWVFTDVTCPFCRRMHGDIEDYLELGIEVRYLPYPRYGKGSESWQQTSRAWCATDRLAALTALKKGQSAGRECATGDILDRYTDVAERIGVRATPTLILQDGRKIDGLVSAEDLAEVLFADTAPAGGN